jgi:hypothetical protein
MRAEFLIRQRATWDRNWQNDGKGPVDCPPTDRYTSPDGMDELLQAFDHDSVCADNHEIIIHDISMDLGHMPSVRNNRLEFYIRIDVESDEAKSIAGLQRILLDGLMFWCDNWVDDMRSEIIEVKHL